VRDLSCNEREGVNLRDPLCQEGKEGVVIYRGRKGRISKKKRMKISRFLIGVAEKTKGHPD